MSGPIKDGDFVQLKPGTTSYNHFSGYMPTQGKVIEYAVNHKVGHINRPFHVKFVDNRTAWYSRAELVHWDGVIPGKGPLTSGGYPV